MRRIQDMVICGTGFFQYTRQSKWLFMVATVVITAILLCNVSDISGFSSDSAKEKSYKYYTSIVIQKGDSLWSIAEEYMTDEYDGIEEYIWEIRRVNHICGDRIYAGQYLAIPRYMSEL